MRKMGQQITADKRKIKDLPKFAHRRTAFTRKTLYAVPPLVLKSLMPIFNVKEVEP